MEGVSNPMQASILICTRNRAEMLDGVLSSLVAADRAPSLAWEVVVCDNGSTDDTIAVAAGYADRLPLRIVECPMPGIGRARNTAIEAAQGRWLVLLDDDVIVEREWLVELLAACERDDDAAFVGGRIDAQFDAIPDRLVRLAFPHVQNYFSILPASAMSAPPGVEQLPYAANLALRHDWARRHPFDPRIGYQPGMPASAGEETDVLTRMIAAGGRGAWAPDAVVRHRLPAYRVRVGWLLQRLRGAAVEAVALGIRPGRGALFRIPLHLWLDIARFAGAAAMAAATLRVPTMLGRLAWLYQRIWTAYFARHAALAASRS